jgi:hypothetical protein
MIVVLKDSKEVPDIASLIVYRQGSPVLLAQENLKRGSGFISFSDVLDSDFSNILSYSDMPRLTKGMEGLVVFPYLGRGIIRSFPTDSFMVINKEKVLAEVFVSPFSVRYFD